jgi:hypothetical protein
MKVLCNCGRSGNAEKIMVQDHDKKLYVCYCYLGNPSQDFVIDERGNLVDGEKEAVVKITARDYIFHTKY